MHMKKKRYFEWKWVGGCKGRENFKFIEMS